MTLLPMRSENFEHEAAPRTAAGIVEAAVNRLTTKRTDSRVPRSPSDINVDALSCIGLGVAIARHHHDEFLWGESGAHASGPYIDARQPALAAHPDVFLYPMMMSGGPETTVASRWAHSVELVLARTCEVELVAPNSISLGLVEDRGLPARR